MPRVSFTIDKGSLIICFLRQGGDGPIAGFMSIPLWVLMVTVVAAGAIAIVVTFRLCNSKKVR